MHLIFQHVSSHTDPHGWKKSLLNEHDRLEDWPHTDLPLTHVTGVERFYTDRDDNVNVVFGDDDGIVLPHTKVIQGEPEGDDE